MRGETILQCVDMENEFDVVSLQDTQWKEATMCQYNVSVPHFLE